MGISLSGGDYQYNRFDAYEKALGEELTGARLDRAEAKKKELGRKKSTRDERVALDRVARGREGTGVEGGYKAPISRGGGGNKGRTKVSGTGGDDADRGDGNRAARRAAASMVEGKDASNPEEMKKKVDKAGKKAKKTGRYLSDEDKEEEGKEEVETASGSDGGGSMGEELNNQETGNTVMENNQRMAMYSRALGMMGAQYSGPGFGISGLVEKKEEEDKKESKGSKPDYLDFDKDGDKKEAMKKALKEKGDKEEVEEGYKPLPTEKMGRQANKAYGKEQQAVRAGDEAGANKQMQRRIAIKDPKGRKAVMAKEEVSITKDMVVEYLVSEGYASNEVSAEILHTHISDGFLATIEESMIAEMGPAHPVETKAQAKAQTDHRAGKSSAGLKTGKNPGTQKGEGYNTTN